MKNPIDPAISQPVDEEAEIADFLPPDLALEGHTTLSTDWRLEYLDQLHLTMEDPRFLVLPPTAQLLYLHLLRKTHGQGDREVRISIDRLVAETKLAWMTVQKQLKTLGTMGLVTTSLPARQRIAPTYVVHWLPRLEKRENLKDVISRFDELDEEDLGELKRLAPLISASQREGIVAEIQLSLRADGLVPSQELVTKILSYRILHRFPYKHRLMAKHPDWYDLASPR
ncbi:MAG: hypothetical protein KF747_16715 [Nitrospira sp.]|nr:hypothetical protein [Nitrospira sp.]MBX3350365.1 hypothetical protein [Nitrospira sp.]